MAAPAGKASRTGALQPRAQKGRVRRAVRISSLVAQEVGDRPSPSPSLRGGGTEMDAAQRALAPGRERASEMQDGLGALGSVAPRGPFLAPACSLCSRPAGPRWTVFFLPALPFSLGFRGPAF